MAYTPQYASDFSTPPSPLFPPVPNVSRASIESLNLLYESDAARSSDNDTTPPRTPQKTYYGMSTRPLLFSEEDLFKAFADRTLSSSPRSKGERLAHDSSDPTSPWKRSIRLKYSEVNMREANSDKLREASDLLAKDMSSYVNSEDESVQEGSGIGKFSPGAASANLKAKLADAINSLHDENGQDSKDQ